MKRAKDVFTVLNPKGLHTRPSTALVKCAFHFDSQIRLYYRNSIVDAKSILGILSLAAGKGAQIGVEAVGNDADKAVSAILKLARNSFDIKY